MPSQVTTPLALAILQAPTVELRDNEGTLLSKITPEAAAELIDRGWADAIGKKTVKYIRLRADAPLRLLGKSWRGGNRTTRAVRADQTCTSFEPGQVMGSPRLIREHKPL